MSKDDEKYCLLCKKLLDVEGDVASKDCGGDCLECMADSGDDDCMKILMRWKKMNAKVLFNDPSNRWKSGDVGKVEKLEIENKYDYAIDFGMLKNVEFLGKKQDVCRVYYFYENEIEIMT